LTHAGIEEVAKPRFESQPSVEYKLWEDGIQSQRRSWLQASEGSSKLPRSKMMLKVKNTLQISYKTYK